MTTVIAIVLVLTAGYLIGMQHERDRCHAQQRVHAARPTPTYPLDQFGSDDGTLSPREWGQLVTAIYDHADSGDPETRQ